MSKYIKNCKHCGAQMPRKEIICHNCGGLNKPPIYKRPWFIIIAIILVIGIWNNTIGRMFKDSAPDNVQEAAIEYQDVTVDEMLSELDENPVNASEKYKDAYWAVKGTLDVMDSDGEYIGIGILEDSFSVSTVHCSITTEEQLENVKSLKKGDIVTVKGKVTDVGEIMGYSMDIDSIEQSE